MPQAVTELPGTFYDWIMPASCLERKESRAGLRLGQGSKRANQMTDKGTSLTRRPTLDGGCRLCLQRLKGVWSDQHPREWVELGRRGEGPPALAAYTRRRRQTRRPRSVRRGKHRDPSKRTRGRSHLTHSPKRGSLKLCDGMAGRGVTGLRGPGRLGHGAISPVHRRRHGICVSGNYRLRWESPTVLTACLPPNGSGMGGLVFPEGRHGALDAPATTRGAGMVGAWQYPCATKQRG